MLGKKSPVLFTKEMAKLLPVNHIIVDIADNVEEGIKAIRDKTIVTKISHSASLLYSNNLFNFFELIYDKENKKLNINQDDEIISKTFVEKK